MIRLRDTHDHADPRLDHAAEVLRSTEPLVVTNESRRRVRLRLLASAKKSEPRRLVIPLAFVLLALAATVASAMPNVWPAIRSLFADSSEPSVSSIGEHEKPNDAPNPRLRRSTATVQIENRAAPILLVEETTAQRPIADVPIEDVPSLREGNRLQADQKIRLSEENRNVHSSNADASGAQEVTSSSSNMEPTRDSGHFEQAKSPQAPQGAELVIEGVTLLRQRGNPAGALAAFDRYRTQFPSGPLSEEALAWSIEAADAVGAKARATALANEYLAHHPKGRFASSANAAIKKNNEKY